MKERLIELIYKSAEEFKDVDCTPKEAVVILADYLIANGAIVPPCKFGDTVYRVVTMGTGVTFKKVGFNTYQEKKQTIKHFIRCVTVTKNNLFDVCENWGISVFATKEEAEQKLKERDIK